MMVTQAELAILIILMTGILTWCGALAWLSIYAIRQVVRILKKGDDKK